MTITRDHIGRWLERHGIERSKRTGPVTLIVTDRIIARKPVDPQGREDVMARVPVWVAGADGTPAFDLDVQEFVTDTVTVPFDIEVELTEDVLVPTEGALTSTEEDSFTSWLLYGIEQGWVSEGHCDTHDRMPVTDEEEAAFDEGGDPCIPVLRVWGAEGRMSGDGS